jgi:hypothetical protein
MSSGFDIVCDVFTVVDNSAIPMPSYVLNAPALLALHNRQCRADSTLISIS